jgi:hypothetical protein
MQVDREFSLSVHDRIKTQMADPIFHLANKQNNLN